jgi:hypothetical protein
MNTTATRTVTTIALLTLLGIGTVSCSGEPVAPAPPESAPSASEDGEVVEEAPAPMDLDGEWKQTNSNDPESFQTATIMGETIEVYWNAPDTKSLYWAGTVEVPQDGSTSFTWESVNDTTKTDSAMLASGDDVKTFTLENGELAYEVTALGTTMTVRLTHE